MRGHYDLLFLFSGHSDDPLVLKQGKCTLNRIIPLLLGHLKNHDRAQEGHGAQALSQPRRQALCSSHSLETLGARLKLSFIRGHFFWSCGCSLTESSTVICFYNLFLHVKHNIHYWVSSNCTTDPYKLFVIFTEQYVTLRKAAAVHAPADLLKQRWSKCITKKISMFLWGNVCRWEHRRTMPVQGFPSCIDLCNKD